MNLIETKTRGTEAQNLLRNELLLEALKQVRYAAHRAFEQANGDDAKLRRASHLLDAANDLHRFLKIAISSGEAAAKQIDRELNEGRFVRGVGRLVRGRDSEADTMPWSNAG